MTTINDLKNALGQGLGSRKNRFLIELSFENLDSSKFNILCKSVQFPQRTINTVQAWYHGRKYNLRGDTDYGGTLEVTLLDDDKLTLRRFFDQWAKKIDDTSQLKVGSFKTSESSSSSIFGMIDTVNEIVNDVKEFAKDPIGTITSNVKDIFNDISDAFWSGFLGKSLADYQAEINIWQLSNTGEKVYGYKIQNAFPTGIGEVTYDNSETDSIVEYNITFTFSEFEPIEKDSWSGNIKDWINGANNI